MRYLYYFKPLYLEKRAHHYSPEALMNSTCEKAQNSRDADSLEVETVKEEIQNIIKKRVDEIPSEKN